TRTGFDRSDGLLISSSEDRDYRLFEVTPKGVAMTPAVEGKLFCTNTYIHPKFQQYNKQWGTIYENRFRDPRYIRIQELMAANPQTREDAFNILNDTVQPGFQDKAFLGQATINRFVTHVSALMVFPLLEGHSETGVWIARDHTYAAYNEYSFFNFSALPQKNIKTRPANNIIGTEKFNHFKKFMHLRETRYDAPPTTLIREGETLLHKEPDNPIFILFVAQTYFKYGKFHEALEILEKHPLEWTADYWYCMGKCKHELKLYQEAKHCFIKAMELPCIDGFPELVRTVCLIQLVKVNERLGLIEEVLRLKEEIKNLRAKFATPNIGMPDYPYINNIVEQMEEIVL
ncbi:MAG: CDC27 family protein, partial [Candidatus Aminicenantes bacterium]